MLTRNELADLAALVTRQAIEAEQERRYDVAERLDRRAAALREASR